MLQFSIQLRAARKGARLSQRHVAALGDLTLRAVRKLEAGGGRLADLAGYLRALGAGVEPRIGGIADIRRERGLSLRDLAAAAGCSHSSIVAVESKGNGRMATLAAIWGALGIQPSLRFDQSARVICGDALTTLGHMASESIDVVITSPPFYRQRDYDGGAGLGNESSVEEFIANLLAITAELHRVLRREGSSSFVCSLSLSVRAVLDAPRCAC